MSAALRRPTVEAPADSRVRSSDEVPARLERPKVYIFARKILVRNTRIFKQAKSLTDAGYDVTVIGIQPRDVAEREERDGYLILRLKLDPLYASLPRRLRQSRARGERWLRRAPGAYRRRTASVARRRRLAMMAFRRRRRLFVYSLRRRRRAAERGLRTWRRSLGTARRRRLNLIVERRWIIVRFSWRGRRYRFRVRSSRRLYVVAQAVSRRRRIRRMTWRRRRRLIRYRIGRRKRLIWLGARRAFARVRRLARPTWKRLRPYVRALLREGGALSPDEEDEAERDVEIKRWMEILGSPLVLAVRLGGKATKGGILGAGAARRLPEWLRTHRLIEASLRQWVDLTIRFSRVVSDFFLARLNRILRRFSFPLRSVAYYRAAYKLATERLPPPEIIHANDLDTLFIAALLARRYRVPLVYDAQELYTGLHTLGPWYRRFLSLQERLLIKRADRITVVNDAIADVMAKRYHVQIDSVILNCPPYEDKPYREGTGRSVRDIFRIPDEEVVLLYSGGLGKDRGIENTILSLSHLRNVSLVVLGDGPLKATLLDLMREHDLGHRVYFTDFVPHTEVPRLISSADIGVIPYEKVGINHYLCSPSKMFHYIMAELPIVCSDFPFLRKVVVDNGIGRAFDPSNPESIAAAIRELVNVKGAHAACKEQIRVVKRRYCWEEEERRFLGLYASLLAEIRTAREESYAA